MRLLAVSLSILLLAGAPLASAAPVSHQRSAAYTHTVDSALTAAPATQKKSPPKCC